MSGEGRTLSAVEVLVKGLREAIADPATEWIDVVGRLLDNYDNRPGAVDEAFAAAGRMLVPAKKWPWPGHSRASCAEADWRDHLWCECICHPITTLSPEEAQSAAARPGYARCDECGRYNPPWFTDDATWRERVPEDTGKGGPQGFGVVLCPVCFAKRQVSAPAGGVAEAGHA